MVKEEGVRSRRKGCGQGRKGVVKEEGVWSRRKGCGQGGRGLSERRRSVDGEEDMRV